MSFTILVSCLADAVIFCWSAFKIAHLINVLTSI